MATSTKPNLPSIEQKAQLEEDLSTIDERVEGIITLMRACYGDGSQAAIRADQIAGAVQRLKWELERAQQSMLTASA